MDTQTREQRDASARDPTDATAVGAGCVCHVLEAMFRSGTLRQPQLWDSVRIRGLQGTTLRRVDDLLCTRGYTWVVDADLKSYFRYHSGGEVAGAGSPPRSADGRVLDLVQAYLRQRCTGGRNNTDGLRNRERQGGVVSPLLSNIYLDPLDHHMAARGIEMVRYADDLCTSIADGETRRKRALAEVQRWTAQAALALHPEKTRIVDATHEEALSFSGITLNGA